MEEINLGLTLHTASEYRVLIEKLGFEVVARLFPSVSTTYKIRYNDEIDVVKVAEHSADPSGYKHVHIESKALERLSGLERVPEKKGFYMLQGDFMNGLVHLIKADVLSGRAFRKDHTALLHKGYLEGKCYMNPRYSQLTPMAPLYELVSSIHSRGVAALDLESRNVLITPQLELCLFDFSHVIFEEEVSVSTFREECQKDLYALEKLV